MRAAGDPSVNWRERAEDNERLRALALNEVAAMRRDLSFAHDERARMVEDQQQLAARLAQQREELGLAQAELGQTRADLQRTRQELQQAQQELRQTRGDAERLREDLASTQARLRRTKAALQDYRSSIERIKKPIPNPVWRLSTRVLRQLSRRKLADHGG